MQPPPNVGSNWRTLWRILCLHSISLRCAVAQMLVCSAAVPVLGAQVSSQGYQDTSGTHVQTLEGNAVDGNIAIE